MIWYVPAPRAQPVGLVGVFGSVCLVGLMGFLHLSNISGHLETVKV